MHDFNAIFAIGTIPIVRLRDNTGFVWGFLTLKAHNYKFIVYIDEPVLRGRVNAVQNVSGKFLDAFGYENCAHIPFDDEIVQDAHFLKNYDNTPWSKKISIPDEYFDGDMLKYSDKIIYYLRRIDLGCDYDKRIFKIPPIEELEKLINENKLSEEVKH